MKTKLFSLIFTMFCLSLMLNSSAQIDVKQKAKDKSIERADQRTDEGIDAGLDAAESGVKSVFQKKDKSKDEEEEYDDDSGSDDEYQEDDEASSNADIKSSAQPSLQSYTKYDFVPGDKVLFFEDFSQDAVGDFPALWTTNGSGEVKTLNLYPGHWMHMLATDMEFLLMGPITLPENFIFEFDVIPVPQPEAYDASFSFCLYNYDNDDITDAIIPGYEGVIIKCSENEWTVTGYSEEGDNMNEGSTSIATLETEKLNHVIIWIQKRRVRIYHRGQKALDLPTVLYPGQKCNHLRFSLWGCTGFPYISNLRFTTASPDMRSKLLTEGKIVSYGIYFDVNSDKVKSESYGALNEIAKVLAENPSVKIQIVGHTDSDGDDAKNLDLSKRRAISVMNELTKSFGIDASRMTTDGKGESQPVAPNDTPANKAKNRRVEFIKI
jgi:OOP family OmpA-OmpF porin